MTRHKDFHESYYEHNCAVTDTEDVLESDIPGNKVLSKLKKWWFDRFLVAYSDAQAQLYFSSSHAMRMERYRQYRTHRSRIHPLSKFRNFQGVFMFILFLINTMLFHHNTSILFGQLYASFYYFGALLEWIVIADVFVNCQVGYIDNETKKIILDKRLGLLHYCSTKVFVHVASAIPLQCVLLLRYGPNIDCSLCKMNIFVTTLKFISIFRLFRIYEHSSFLTWERSSYVATHILKLLRIYLVGMMIMLYYIDLSDAVTALYMIRTGKLNDDAYVSGLIRAKYVYPNTPSNYTFFIYNFGRITKSILLFSLGFQKKKYYLDIIVSMVAFAIAHLIYLWEILECFNFLSTLCFLDDSVIKLKQTLGNFVRCRQLPDNVTRKLESYYDYNQSKMRAMEQSNNFLATLPEILKAEVLLTRHTRHVRRIPFFSEWPLEVVEGLVMKLKEEIYLTNDLIAEPWVQSEGLLIVSMGELAVYSGEEETGHLIDGDYFGELSLVTDKELRTSRVLATTPCIMLLLEKYAFRAHMRQYPELFAALKQEILNDLGLGNESK